MLKYGLTNGSVIETVNDSGDKGETILSIKLEVLTYDENQYNFFSALDWKQKDITTFPVD